MKSESKKPKVKPVASSEQSQLSTFYRKSLSSAKREPLFYTDAAALSNTSAGSFSFGFEPDANPSVVDSSSPVTSSAQTDMCLAENNTVPPDSLPVEKQPCIAMTECFRASPAGSTFTFNFTDS